MRCMVPCGSLTWTVSMFISWRRLVTWFAPSWFVRMPLARIMVSGLIQQASAPSNTPFPLMQRRSGMPRMANFWATNISSPARTEEAGRARMAPSGVMKKRSAMNIWFGGGV